MLEDLISGEAAAQHGERALAAVARMSDFDLESQLARSLNMEQLLVGYCRRAGLRFAVGGEIQPTATILASDVFMPVVALQAEGLALEMLQSALRESGSTIRLPALPLGSLLQRDPQAALEVFCSVPRLTNDGWGSLRAVMFVSAMTRVFGEPGSAAAPRVVDCEGLYAMYAPGGEQSVLQHLMSSGIDVGTQPTDDIGLSSHSGQATSQ